MNHITYIRLVNALTFSGSTSGDAYHAERYRSNNTMHGAISPFPDRPLFLCFPQSGVVYLGRDAIPLERLAHLPTLS